MAKTAVANAKKYYAIKVGVTKPQLVEVGEVNKATGLPMGQTEKAESVVGKITIPNYSRIWAKSERRKDGQLTGEFTELPWGVEDGEVTEIRHSSNCKSLLKLYQEQIKLSFNEKDAEISLLYGVNYIDKEKAPGLVRMLQLHTYNGDNKSRDPDNQHIIFRQYDPKKERDGDPDNIKYRDLREAMAFLHTINDEPRRLHVMAIAFGVDEQLPDEEIILKLTQRAHHEPTQFLSARDDHYAKVQAILYRAHDLMVVDLTEPESILLMSNGKAERVFGGFTATEGIKKLDYLVTNAFEPEAGEAIEKISRALAFREAKLS